MSLFTSRQGAILWRELPEFMRLFDNPVTLDAPDPDNPGGTISVSRPGDLRNFLDGFGHALDRYEATLSQFYADGFVAADPVDPDVRQIQPWLVPYFADLFGVTLYAPDPESRRQELSQAIWVARRRGTRLAVDRAAESILGLGVVAVPGLDRMAFAPSLRQPLLTAAEITGTPHARDPVILHRPMAGDETQTALRTRHPGLAGGTRDMRFVMRARRATGFVLGADSKPAQSDTGERIALRFTIADRAGVACFPASFEDRTLRTADIRAPAQARGPVAGIARPDVVTLHVDPPRGVFDGGPHRVDEMPVLADGVLQSAESPLPAGKTPFYAPSSTDPTLRATRLNGRDGTRRHEIDGLVFDGTLTVAEGNLAVLTDFAIRRIVLRRNAMLIARNGLCDTIEAAETGASCEMEYVTVTDAAVFRDLNASDCLLRRVGTTVAGRRGCLRYSRFDQGQLRANIARPNTTQGPFRFVDWPCLRDLSDPGLHLSRPALFGEPGWGVLSPDIPESVATGAEDGTEPGGYHGRFHLARLAAARRRAQDFAPAGHRVFARYDMRSAVPLPDVTTDQTGEGP